MVLQPSNLRIWPTETSVGTSIPSRIMRTATASSLVYVLTCLFWRVSASFCVRYPAKFVMVCFCRFSVAAGAVPCSTLALIARISGLTVASPLNFSLTLSISPAASPAERAGSTWHFLRSTWHCWSRTFEKQSRSFCAWRNFAVSSSELISNSTAVIFQARLSALEPDLQTWACMMQVLQHVLCELLGTTLPFVLMQFSELHVLTDIELHYICKVALIVN